jgi:hypothetical protein
MIEPQKDYQIIVGKLQIHPDLLSLNQKTFSIELQKAGEEFRKNRPSGTAEEAFSSEGQDFPQWMQGCLQIANAHIFNSNLGGNNLETTRAYIESQPEYSDSQWSTIVNIAVLAHMLDLQENRPDKTPRDMDVIQTVRQGFAKGFNNKTWLVGGRAAKRLGLMPDEQVSKS